MNTSQILYNLLFITELIALGYNPGFIRSNDVYFNIRLIIQFLLFLNSFIPENDTIQQTPLLRGPVPIRMTEPFTPPPVRRRSARLAEKYDVV